MRGHCRGEKAEGHDSAAALPLDGSQAAIDACDDYIRQLERILAETRQPSSETLARTCVIASATVVG